MVKAFKHQGKVYFTVDGQGGYFPLPEGLSVDNYGEYLKNKFESQPTKPTGPEPGVITRFAKGAREGISDSAARWSARFGDISNIGAELGPTVDESGNVIFDPTTPEGRKQVVPTYDSLKRSVYNDLAGKPLPPARGWVPWGAQLAGHLAGLGPEFYLLRRAIGPLASSAGVGPKATEVLTEAGIGAGMGASEEHPTTAVPFNAALFGAFPMFSPKWLLRRLGILKTREAPFKEGGKVVEDAAGVAKPTTEDTATAAARKQLRGILQPESSQGETVVVNEARVPRTKNLDETVEQLNAAEVPVGAVQEEIPVGATNIEIPTFMRQGFRPRITEVAPTRIPGEAYYRGFNRALGRPEAYPPRMPDIGPSPEVAANYPQALPWTNIRTVEPTQWTPRRDPVTGRMLPPFIPAPKIVFPE